MNFYEGILQGNVELVTCKCKVNYQLEMVIHLTVEFKPDRETFSQVSWNTFVGSSAPRWTICSSAG